MRAGGIAGAAAARRRALGGGAEPARDLPPARSARHAARRQSEWLARRRARRPTATSSFRSTCTRAAAGPPKSHPAKAKVFANDAGYRLLVGRDVHDLVQSQQQIKTAILLGIGAMVVLGLLGGLILSRWMLTPAGADQPVDRADHGRRLRPPHRHRRATATSSTSWPRTSTPCSSGSSGCWPACARSARTSPTICARP